ncbi:MAG: hypothetical protein ABFC24_12150 [Methanoregulaceae archaeon]
MMANEFILVGIAAGAVFSVAASVGLLHLGTMIDRFPSLSDRDRKRNLASPVESTRLTVILCWILFIAGTAMLLQAGRLNFIGGIVALFSETLFLATGLGLSFAVLHAMRTNAKKEKKSKDIADLETALLRISRETGVAPKVLLTRLRESSESIPVQVRAPPTVAGINDP